ncbi:MAG: HDIG domain-containing protein [Chloroflexi bacterium]|nr:MAG: HDIG domain-containing protein [Chloroflexota bacterium]
MFATPAERATPFRRRDAIRLAVFAAFLVAAMTAILGADIVPRGLGLEAGDVAPEDIRAPRTLDVVSTIATQRARQAARDAVPFQYDYTPERAATIADQQGTAFARSVAAADAAFQANLKPQARQELLKSVLPSLAGDTRATLLELTPERWKAVRADAARLLDEVERTELRDTDIANAASQLRGRTNSALGGPERDLVVALVQPLLVANSSYSQALTDQARQRAEDAVTPVHSTIRTGQTIVRKGDPITEEDLEKINAFDLNRASLDAAKLAGWALLAAIFVSMLLAWVWRFRPSLWHRDNALLLVGLMLVVATFGLKLTAGRSILAYFVPVAAAGMLIAILLDAGAATVVVAVLALLGGAVNGGSIEMATYIFVGGFVGILAVRRGDRLNPFVQAAVAMTVANVIVVSTFALLGEHDLTGVFQLWTASVAAAVGSSVAAVGTFAVLGNLFGILTVFQLLELANPSQPLLRRLLVETPGTYHHSIMVGNLAERAAEAIGADPLVTRVAAYYHDIGKLANPLAFIENQAGAENIHDQLEPETSATVLKQHVADGIDIAYKAKLPTALIAFIPQHHGTAIMSYFYARARENAAAPYGGLTTAEGAKAAEAVNERRFRHMGPKPQSREAALIMLADGVEASVRSLSARDEPTIRAMVSRIIDERLADNQFDECDLTLRDVERIREAFVAQLLGMYHQRVAYPQNKIVELESRRAAAGGEDT